MRVIDLKIGNGKVLSRSSSLIGYFILVFPVMGKNKNGGLFFIKNIYVRFEELSYQFLLLNCLEWFPKQ